VRGAILAVGLALSFTTPTLAVLPSEVLPDPAQEQRARALSKELRCMVCQNESIDESNAPLARDLRLLVRERIVAGDTDKQVLDFLVSRYGDFVLLRPRLSADTAILWSAPFLILIAGGVGIFYAARRRSAAPVAPGATALSDAERTRLDELLKRG
jgi:cytochrome c-type biogenesis protein CcmH